MSYKDQKRLKKQQYAERKAQREIERKSRIAKKYVRPAFKELKRERTDIMVLCPEDHWSRSAKSLPMDQIPIRNEIPLKYEDDEMRQCENAARQVAAARSRQLAPLTPKGAYQLITDKSQALLFSKK